MHDGAPVRNARVNASCVCVCVCQLKWERKKVQYWCIYTAENKFWNHLKFSQLKSIGLTDYYWSLKTYIFDNTLTLDFKMPICYSWQYHITLTYTLLSWLCCNKSYHFVTLFEGILFYKPVISRFVSVFYSILILYTFIILSLCCCNTQIPLSS